MDSKYYLSKQWILRNEPLIKKHPYLMFNTFTGKQVNLNRSLFLILSEIGRGASVEELAKNFSEEKSTIERYINNIEKEWPNLFSRDYRIIPEYNTANLETFKNYEAPVYSFPVSAEIHLTEKCNLRCRHCIYSCSPYTKTDELQPADWIRVFKEMESHGTVSVTLTGGEILAYKGINEILRAIRDINIHFTLLTNGLLISKEQAELMASPNISLSLSLDGSRAESHDYLRGKGAYVRLMKIIDVLTEFHVWKALSVTINAKNHMEIEAILDYAYSHDCYSVGFIFLDDHGRAEQNRELHLTRDMIEESNRKIGELHNKYSGMEVIILNPSAGISNEKVTDKDNDAIFCTGSTSHISISSEGDIYPCVYAFGSDVFKVGNVQDITLYEAWKTPKWDIMRGGIHLDELKGCSTCKMKHFCSLKSCRVRAFKFRNSLYDKPECSEVQTSVQQLHFGI